MKTLGENVNRLSRAHKRYRRHSQTTDSHSNVIRSHVRVKLEQFSSAAVTTVC